MEQSINEQKDEIKPGVYDFLIKGVQKEKDGYVLKTKNGQTYQRLVIIALGKNKNYTLFESIFGRSNLIPIVNAIANPPLTHVFEQTKSSKEIDLDYFIGEGGKMLVGHREYNGINYPQIECFIKPKFTSIEKAPIVHKNCFENSNPANDFKNELNSEVDIEDVPF